MTWKDIVGRSFDLEGFREYVGTLQWSAWRPSALVLHNTGAPTLADRPSGLTKQHILGLESYYRDEQHWSAGPHMFIDDLRLWVFTPLTTSGIHSPSWTKTSLGIEMLGNYEVESFTTGRGLLVRRHAVGALATLCGALGLASSAIRLHREDPLTTHACPGKNVRKLEVIQEVEDFLLKDHPGEHVPSP